MGDWYVQEYQYTKEMRMKDLSCVGFHFSMSEDEDVVSNFTFRFPAKTGYFYHVPTFSVVSDLDTAVWNTNLKKGCETLGFEIVPTFISFAFFQWTSSPSCWTRTTLDGPFWVNAGRGSRATRHSS